MIPLSNVDRAASSWIIPVDLGLLTELLCQWNVSFDFRFRLMYLPECLYHTASWSTDRWLNLKSKLIRTPGPRFNPSLLSSGNRKIFFLTLMATHSFFVDSKNSSLNLGRDGLQKFQYQVKSIGRLQVVSLDKTSIKVERRLFFEKLPSWLYGQSDWISLSLAHIWCCWFLKNKSGHL